MARPDAGYHLVGCPIPDPPPAVFQLEIEQHVPTVGGIDPRNYFITSGDAIVKSRILARHLRALATPDGVRAAEAADRLVNLLVEARGSAVFLETEWEDHRLLCIPKNPRPRPID